MEYFVLCMCMCKGIREKRTLSKCFIYNTVLCNINKQDKIYYFNLLILLLVHYCIELKPIKFVLYFFPLNPRV